MDLSLILGSLLAFLAIGFLVFIRSRDLPAPVPVSPFKHLDERKAAIYENLRDLQFEYRLDKLSDQDYQTTKLELQKELAKVLAETDRVKAGIGMETSLPGSGPVPAPTTKKNVCAACGTAHEKPQKFCGECGKPLGATA